MLLAALVVVFCLSAVLQVEGRMRVGDVGDVVDDEEDEDWEAWGKFKEKKPSPGVDIEELTSGKVDMAEVMANQNRQGPLMVFVHLFRDKVKSQQETTDMAAKWKEMLMVGGLSTSPYPIQADTVLITIEKGGKDFLQLKEFLLEQDLVEEIELDSQKFRRPGQPPRKQDQSGPPGGGSGGEL